MSLFVDGRDTQSKIATILTKNKQSLTDTAMKTLENAAYPGYAEPAIVHPYHKSVVKLRDNGMIDIFVDKNTGMRVDPETSSINFFANTGKEMYSYLRTHVSKDQTTDVKRSWTINVGTQFNLKAGEMINLEAPRISVNGTKSINMQAPNITMSAQSAVNITAQSSIGLNSSNINLSRNVNCPGHHNRCPDKHGH